jgi:hypothetical protein
VPEAEQRGFAINHEPAMGDPVEINERTLEIIVYNITGTTQVMCSHDGCRVIVSYHESINHQNACLHGWCTCTESGYDFAAPPSMLVIHLAEARSIQVHRNCMPREFRVTMTRPGSR